MGLKLRKANVGNCECCERTEVVLTPMHNGTMLMCEHCIADEAKVAKVETVITESVKAEPVKLSKADIYNVATEAFVEMGAKVHADSEIADEEKKFVYAQRAANEIESLDAAIFEIQDALTKKQNERAAWLKNTHELVATLRIDQRAKFAKFNMEYKPATPTIKRVKKAAKAPKTTTTSSTSVSFKKIKEAAIKAGVDVNSTHMWVAKGLSLEAAIQKMLSKKNDD